MDQPIRVFLVDDHQLILNGVRSMLESDPRVRIMGQASNGEEAVAALLPVPDVDVVLMDIKMPKMNGVDATRRLVDEAPELNVLALTMHEEEEYIAEMLQAGAKGYILKNTSKDDLIEAMETVMAGRPYFCKEVTSAVMSRFMRRDFPRPLGESPQHAPAARGAGKPAGHMELTGREVEILRLIACEMTNHEIAEKLFISPRTVHSHRRNLMQKIGVKNTAGLVRYALEKGILEEGAGT